MLQDFKTEVSPGQEVKYTWYASEESGPQSDSESTRVWIYQSTINLQHDLHSGLFGPIVVVNPKFISTNDQQNNAIPNDVDLEYNLAMTIIDETSSWYVFLCSLSPTHHLPLTSLTGILNKIIN